jgi:hypothetical protein
LRHATLANPPPCRAQAAPARAAAMSLPIVPSRAVPATHRSRRITPRCRKHRLAQVASVLADLPQMSGKRRPPMSRTGALSINRKAPLLVGGAPELAHTAQHGSTALTSDRRIVTQASRIHHGRRTAGRAGKSRHRFRCPRFKHAAHVQASCLFHAEPRCEPRRSRPSTNTACGVWFRNRGARAGLSHVIVRKAPRFRLPLPACHQGVTPVFDGLWRGSG